MSRNDKAKLDHPLVSVAELSFLLKNDRKYLREVSEKAGRYYHPFDFHKKGSDKWRHIDNPIEPLKSIQKKILTNILESKLEKLPEGMTGGITGRSIIDNARIHIAQDCIGIIDIKECFPSTSNGLVFALWRQLFGCGNKTAEILTRLTTLQKRLPQGAPTSPLLCNLILLPVFEEIKSYTDSQNLNLSLFVDDITISGDRIKVRNAISVIISILRSHNYSVRKKKVRIVISGHQQKITGTVINRKLSIGRESENEIRRLIIETAELKEYIPANKFNQISGKLSFAKQVSNKRGEKLEKFANRLLVAPILKTEIESDEERRVCKKYKRDHKYKEI